MLDLRPSAVFGIAAPLGAPARAGSRASDHAAALPPHHRVPHRLPARAGDTGIHHDVPRGPDRAPPGALVLCKPEICGPGSTRPCARTPDPDDVRPIGQEEDPQGFRHTGFDLGRVELRVHREEQPLHRLCLTQGEEVPGRMSGSLIDSRPASAWRQALSRSMPVWACLVEGLADAGKLLGRADHHPHR